MTPPDEPRRFPGHPARNPTGRGPDAAPSSADASALASRGPDDEPFPCPACGYDLRGCPRGGRCPECGGAVPRRPTTLGRPAAHPHLRVRLSGAWQGLGTAALAPVVLLSPIPCLLPFGVALAVCVAFAPGFRLMHLRNFAVLPPELAGPIAPAVARFRRLQFVELAFGGAVVLFAFAWTAGLWGEAASQFYRALILGWWIAAAAGVAAQVRVGEALAPLLVELRLLPNAEVARTRRRFGHAILTAVAGGLSIAASALPVVAAGSSSFAQTAGAVGFGLVAIAAILGAIACMGAKAQADLVASCIMECAALRAIDHAFDMARNAPDVVQRRLAGVVDPRTGEKLDDPDRVTRRAKSTGDDDDSPIPLA